MIIPNAVKTPRAMEMANSTERPRGQRARYQRSQQRCEEESRLAAVCIDPVASVWCGEMPGPSSTAPTA